MIILSLYAEDGKLNIVYDKRNNIYANKVRLLYTNSGSLTYFTHTLDFNQGMKHYNCTQNIEFGESRKIVTNASF